MTEKKRISSRTKKKINLLFTILKFVVLILILIGIPIYIYLFHGEALEQFKSLDDMNAFILQYETASIFVYIGLQVLQIIICIIPGQALQFAGGYAFSFWLGYLYALIGIALGTIITFYLARILGRDALHVLFGEKRFNKFIDKLNTKRAFIIVFMLYLIPGIPKDLFNYAAGVSDMKLKPFCILSLVARTPAMMAGIMVGSMFNKGSYFGICVLAVIAVILCFLGVRYHERLTIKVDDLYTKFVRMMY